MRARKPSLRFRTRFEGWNVRFMVSVPSSLWDKCRDVDVPHGVSRQAAERQSQGGRADASREKS